VKLRVLGNTGRYLAPLSAGSGYLLESGDARVLLDCGGGVRDALARLGVDRVDAVVVSHFHHDHVLDLITMRELLAPDVPLLLPPGETERLEDLARAFAFRGPFEVQGPVVEAHGARQVGSLRLTFAPTRHSAPSFATRVEDGSGASLVYASDTAPCAPLVDLARGADLLLMHALLPAVDRGSSHAQRHATAETSAQVAREAGAGTLLLSHRYHESKDADMLAHAKAHPRVELARDGEARLIRRDTGRPS
jgi:ribonuclease BN (tRNA processing enzyme)